MNLTKEDKELIKKAEILWKSNYVSKRHSVSCILQSKSGKIINGMSMEFDCGIATCAERVAMFKLMPEEDEIRTIVAMYKDKIIPPCGVCRELMYQMNNNNLNNTWIILSNDNKVKLKDFTEFDWKNYF